MRYYSKRFTVYYYPGHWIQYQSCTMKCTFSTPWGAFWLGATSGVHTCHIMQQITFASYRVPIYTPGWRAAMWIKCLAEGQKVPGIDRNRTRNPLIQSQGLNPIYHGTSTTFSFNLLAINHWFTCFLIHYLILHMCF